MDYSEKTVDSKSIFEGNILKLRVDKVLLPDGNMSTREIVTHNGGVGIVAVMDKKIILVRQFRKPIEESILEIPAGKLEPGEDPAHCAIREMEEETGLIPRDLSHLITIYPSPGFSSERLYIYTANSLTSGKISRDKDEFMDIIYVDIDEALSMIKNGRIKDAKTICGIMIYRMCR